MSEYKVLIPLDGSRLAEHALAFLPAMSHFGDLNVRLVSVVDYTDDLVRLIPSEEQEREYNLLSTYLREVQADLEKHLKAKVQGEVQYGEGARVILDQAGRFAPDVLIISTHGRSGLSRWQRGSVADKVLRGADCPVMAIGPKAMEQGQWLEAEAVPPFKQILVPLDGSELSEQALPHASEFAERFGSRVHLLQVLPFVPLSSTLVQTPTRLTEEVLRSGDEYLAGVVAKLSNTDNVVAAAHIGAPKVAIEEYVRANEIDLIVMTSHGRGGLSRATLGSVTDRLIGLGPPVLIVRAKG